MQEEFKARQTWPFECTRCLEVWEEEYVVRHLTDGHGHDMDVWTRADLQVQPPWSDVRCPSCGGAAVKTFPRGYLSRHPEIRPSSQMPAGMQGAMETEPSAVEPVVPVSGGRSFAASLRTHSLAYAVIALSVLLVTSVELYEIIRSTHVVH